MMILVWHLQCPIVPFDFLLVLFFIRVGNSHFKVKQKGLYFRMILQLKQYFIVLPALGFKQINRIGVNNFILRIFFNSLKIPLESQHVLLPILIGQTYVIVATRKLRIDLNRLLIPTDSLVILVFSCILISYSIKSQCILWMHNRNFLKFDYPLISLFLIQCINHQSILIFRIHFQYFVSVFFGKRFVDSILLIDPCYSLVSW